VRAERYRRPTPPNLARGRLRVSGVAYITIQQASNNPLFARKWFLRAEDDVLRSRARHKVTWPQATLLISIPENLGGGLAPILRKYRRWGAKSIHFPALDRQLPMTVAFWPRQIS